MTGGITTVDSTNPEVKGIIQYMRNFFVVFLLILQPMFLRK